MVPRFLIGSLAALTLAGAASQATADCKFDRLVEVPVTMDGLRGTVATKINGHDATLQFVLLRSWRMRAGSEKKNNGERQNQQRAAQRHPRSWDQHTNFIVREQDSASAFNRMGGSLSTPYRSPPAR